MNATEPHICVCVCMCGLCFTRIVVTVHTHPQKNNIIKNSCHIFVATAASAAASYNKTTVENIYLSILFTSRSFLFNVEREADMQTVFVCVVYLCALTASSCYIHTKSLLFPSSSSRYSINLCILKKF